MAKSLRSKWRRKCRAVKRERYGQKELERLKKTLGIDDTSKANLDIVMTNVSEIAEVKDAKEIQKGKEENVEEAEEAERDVEMDVDGKKKLFNAKTLRDQNGAYPVWLHPRKIQKKSKRKVKKSKGKSKKKPGKK